MLARGVYLPPSQFEVWCVSLAHTEADIAATLAAARAAFAEVAAAG
jgi:glutamate-1-semialdehyde 2,1-aminomutase